MKNPLHLQFKDLGKVAIWHYKDNPKNYPGLHFTASDKACDCLIAIFNEVLSKNSSFHLEMPLYTKDKRVHEVTGCSLKFKLYKTLNLIYKLKEPNLITFAVSDESITIKIGKEKLNEFNNGLIDIKNCEGDYTIGNYEKTPFNQMWFWWDVGEMCD